MVLLLNTTPSQTIIGENTSYFFEKLIGGDINQDGITDLIAEILILVEPMNTEKFIFFTDV